MRLRILAGTAFILGIFGLVHQYIVAGVWWQWEDMAHHEPLIALCFVAGTALIISRFLRRWHEDKKDD